MNYIYVATRVVTYFGTLLRAIWEHIVCRICKLAVEDARAFKNDELCGHVEHEVIHRTKHAFLMCFVPFTMNFVLGCCFLLSGSYRLVYLGDATVYQAYLFMWMGISCLANCAPSFEDMLAFKDCVYGGNNKARKIIFAPFFGIICAAACLEKYSLTFLLSIGFGVAFPYLTAWITPLLNKLISLLA